MTGQRARALAVAAAGLIAAAAFAYAARDRSPPLPSTRPAAERPTLLLLTTLPIVFGEEFGLKASGSPVLKALETRYRVVPIGVADAASLRQGKLLLMAHPLAQPAEDLVALDDWVRRGGRVLLLADPMLDWPSERPLGDPLRPPPMFMDTGLLGHWGLRLDAPDVNGPATRKVDGRSVALSSPGTLSGSCPAEADGLVAHCRIGGGKATVIGDADFLQPAAVNGNQERTNLGFLLDELAGLERR